MTRPLDQLAIHGGPIAVPSGAPPWPPNDEAIRQSLIQVFDSGQWGRYHGQQGELLRDRLARSCGVEHAWLCSSGTIAVELGLRAVGVREADEVVLAGYDFPGNFRAIEAIGARPVLCDIEAATWSLDCNQVADAISHRTKAIVASHLHGGQVDMDSLRALADQHGIPIVEDACQCPGAKVGGSPAGSRGDVGVFSFGGSKLLSAGRGGAVVTNRSDVLQRLKISAERGNDAYPLSELQAAVVVPQLNRLPQDNATRLSAAKRLSQLLQEVCNAHAMHLLHMPENAAFYKFPIRMTPTSQDDSQREALIAAAQAEGIAIDIGFRGFAKRSSRRCQIIGDLTNARNAARGTVVMHHPILLASAELIEQTAAGLCKVIKALLPESS